MWHFFIKSQKTEPLLHLKKKSHYAQEPINMANEDWRGFYFLVISNKRALLRHDTPSFEECVCVCVCMMTFISDL